MHALRISSLGQDADSAVADLTRLPLSVVLDPQDSALDNALRRVLREIDKPGENYAAHGSAPD
jgi:FXSXX-COOH protein